MIENVDGSAYADTLTGDDGSNVIAGNAGADALTGGAGDDTLYGGDGLDTLLGGDGADSFVFENASAFNNVDVVSDFSVAESDVIDITDLLSAYDPMSDVITDFVQITDNGSDSTLAVDTNGGADNFVTVSTLTGVTGLTDEAALVTSGNLLVA